MSRQDDQHDQECAADTRDAMEGWFTRSLSAIGHPDPDSLTPCLALRPHRPRAAPGDEEIRDRKNKADACLQELIVWLEDHAIRQWKIQDRKALRFIDFDSSIIERYLLDLDCPFSLNTSNSSKSSGTLWLNDSEARRRSIFWLLSIAASELYSDEKNKKNSKVKDDVGTIEAEDDGLAASAASIHKESFPLGFTTNDEDIDGIASALRMKYLLDLRNVQNKVNASIANMQRITVKQDKQEKK